MSEFVFKLPDVGEGIAESEIAAWRVAVGDTVAEDQPLVDMLTDKAAVEIPSPVAGVVRALHGEVGDKVAVGAPLVVIALADSPLPPAGEGRGERVSQPATPSPGASRHPLPHAGEGTARAAAAPAVRKLARERGIDLQQVKGTGPSGRILREDLERAARPPGDDDTVERIPLIGVRRKIAEAMQRSAQNIPHFTYVEEIDVTEVEALRRHLNEREPDRPRLTLLPLLIQALARALPEFPQVNATFDEERGEIQRFSALHVGIATQTPQGLMVPVLRNAQRLDLWQRAQEIRRLADAARAGKARREDLSGSTITITSLGALGGIVTTPIINAPEVAIIGVNRIVERAVVRAGAVVVRSTMNLSCSFDHRIVDGYDGAIFVRRIRALLEHPATLFLPDPAP
ncbi:MAG: branched-chain alpha-keto acid dehydrogenase subunit [Panacagrimonas sp.]|nr:dihydrolipoamide acetyltransferase family protein [Panacagrimonas sp.]MCC2656971.1 branched-chain alpha-keto acid dehydrogenase subunit [Panacagrimonas sp.]